MRDRPGCLAQQHSDEMVCNACRLRWDVHDTEAPECRSTPPVMRAASPPLHFNEFGHIVAPPGHAPKMFIRDGRPVPAPFVSGLPDRSR